MAQATVPEDGDAIEKATWPALALFFPHYEEFWTIHLAPLRSTGSIHPRRGIDDDFQFLAMQHYSLMSFWEKPTNESWGRKRSRARVRECRLLLTTTAKTKAPPSQAHQGKSDGHCVLLESTSLAYDG
jgi:hypothetical protein